MIDLTALAQANTVADVMALLPTEAPAITTHVVLAVRSAGPGAYQASEVYAVDRTPETRPGQLFVQTLGGPKEVQPREVLAQAMLSGHGRYGAAENWSRHTAGHGSGFHATHAEALAALPGLAAAALKQLNRRY